jgi:hypothetical protein
MVAYDEINDPGVLIASTETREGIASRVFLALMMGGLCAVPFVMSYYHPRPQDWTQIRSGFEMIGLMVAVMLFLMVMTSWGTWVIDLKGVTFEPCHGSPRRLEWARVEKVAWSHTGTKLYGDGVTITIRWHHLSKEPRRIVRERVEKLLSSDFDLTDPLPPPPVPEMSSRAIFMRWARFVAITLILFALYAAVALDLARRFPRPGQGSYLAAWLGIPISVICLFVLTETVWSSIQQTRDIKRIHPAWPWRLRRTKLAPDDW